MAERLAVAGHSVIATTSVPALIYSAVRDQDPDIVVLGKYFGAEAGLEVARRVVEVRKVPVILVVDTFSAARNTAAGSPDVVFMSRDASQSELLARVESARARHDHDEQLRHHIERLKQRLQHEPKIASAKKRLMEELGIDEERAYGRLRKASQDRRLPLHKIADEILAGGERAAPDQRRRI